MCMVLELVLPAVGVLAISGGAAGVAYYVCMKRIEKTVKQIEDTQDMRDKRIRDAIKETLVNDLDKLKAEEIRIRETVEGSISTLKQVQVERGEFKKEVANHLRDSLKDELGSRLRDMMARLTQVSQEQNRLEEMTNNTKNEVKTGVMQVSSKLSSLKDETRKVEDKFIEIQDMFHKLMSRKDEIQSEVIASVKKEGLNEVYARMAELDTRIKLGKDAVNQVERDRDLIITRMKNMDTLVPHMIRSSKEEAVSNIKAVKEGMARDTARLKDGLVVLAKVNKKQREDLAKLGRDLKKQDKQFARVWRENKRLSAQILKLKKKPASRKKKK